jgi:DNA helicase-2/ATP-dependent DNA helicase PcrA
MMPTSAPDVLIGLTPQQCAAANASGPGLVLAGAGTGKTKALTAVVGHRIAACRIPAAAAETTARIRTVLGGHTAPNWVGTFHGLGARQLRIQPEVAGLWPGFDILDADDARRLVKRTLKALHLAADDDDKMVAGRDPLKVMCNRISRFKDSLILPQEAEARVEAMILEASFDFGDLLLWPTRAMQCGDAAIYAGFPERHNLHPGRELSVHAAHSGCGECRHRA